MELYSYKTFNRKWGKLLKEENFANYSMKILEFANQSTLNHFVNSLVTPLIENILITLNPEDHRIGVPYGTSQKSTSFQWFLLQENFTVLSFVLMEDYKNVMSLIIKLENLCCFGSWRLQLIDWYLPSKDLMTFLLSFGCNSLALSGSIFCNFSYKTCGSVSSSSSTLSVISKRCLLGRSSSKLTLASANQIKRNSFVIQIEQLILFFQAYNLS